MGERLARPLPLTTTPAPVAVGGRGQRPTGVAVIPASDIDPAPVAVGGRGTVRGMTGSIIAPDRRNVVILLPRMRDPEALPAIPAINWAGRGP